MSAEGGLCTFHTGAVTGPATFSHSPTFFTGGAASHVAAPPLGQAPSPRPHLREQGAVASAPVSSTSELRLFQLARTWVCSVSLRYHMPTMHLASSFLCATQSGAICPPPPHIHTHTYTVRLQMDLPGSLEAVDIGRLLGMGSVMDKPWHVQYVPNSCMCHVANLRPLLRLRCRARGHAHVRPAMHPASLLTTTPLYLDTACT